MKQNITFYSGLFLSCLIGIFLFANRNDKEPSNNHGHYTNQTLASQLTAIGVPFEEEELVSGSGEAPLNRTHYQWKRLRSPKTEQIPKDIFVSERLFASTLPKSQGIANRRNNSNRSALVPMNFLNRGPVNVGGRTRALAIDLSDPSENTLLAGGVSGGIWRSTDRGQSWTRTTRQDQFPSVTSIVQDPRPGNTNIWFYGSGETIGNSANGNGGALYRGDGIYRSDNGGQSWEIIPSTSTGDITTPNNIFRTVNSMVINPTNTDLGQIEIYAAVIGGIVRSTDGFETSEFVLGSPTGNNSSIFTEIAVTSSGVFYATLSNFSGLNTEAGIFTSNDGINWTEIPVSSNPLSPGFIRTSIGISASDENIVYFLRTLSSTTDFALFRYDASTGTLEDRSANIPDFGPPIGQFDTQTSYNQYVSVYPENSDIVFLGATNLYRSTNGFVDDTETTWIGGYSPFQNETNNQIGVYPEHHPDNHAILFFSNPREAISSHDGGISMTEDILSETLVRFTDDNGNTVEEAEVVWEELNNGYVTTQFYTLSIDQNIAGDPLFIGGLQDNNTLGTVSRDPSEPWVTITGGDGSFCEITQSSIIVSAQFAQIFRWSRDPESGAISSGALINPPGAGGPPFLFINPFIADPVLPDKFFIGGPGIVYYTLDVEQNPSGDQYLTITDPDLGAAGNVSALDASTQPANILYIGTDSGQLFKVPDSNNPDTLINATPDIFPTGGYINSISVDPKNADIVLVAFSNYDIPSIFSTTDGGNTWSDISGNLEENPDGSGNGVSVRWVSMLPNGEGTVYFAGTSMGLFSTEEMDGVNTTWQQEGAEVLGNVVVDMMEKRTVDGFLGMVSHGNGAFEATAEVPLTANIFMSDLPCQGNEITVFGNQSIDPTVAIFSYEWIINGEVNPNLTTPAITTTGQEVQIQLRLTNELNGEIALSNTIDIQYIYDEFCQEALSTSLIPTLGNSPLLTVFPNPASDVLHISFPTTTDKEWKFQLIDTHGKVHMNTTYFQQNEAEIDIQWLPNGNYWIILQNRNERFSRSWIKVSP